VEREDSRRKQAQPRSVRLPGFVGDEPVGLGDVIKCVTSAAGKALRRLRAARSSAQQLARVHGPEEVGVKESDRMDDNRRAA
jgi:hypothetical protein